VSARITRDEAERFLIREARLIDERQFEEWLALFTPDCLYWLPITDGDPNMEPSLIYDDFARMQERVFRITSTQAPSQSPASRTLHMISNVDVLGEAEGGVRLNANQAIFEFRPGDPSQVGLGVQRVYAASAQYLLVGGPEWRIKLKKLWLLDRDAPHYNLTFVF